MPNIRYIRFQNVVYNLGNGSRLKIIPSPPNDMEEEKNQIHFGHEKYLIEGGGNLKNKNINEESLKTFDNFLSKYSEALRRLT